MPFPNYTTKISVDQTVGEIQAMLRKAGASEVTTKNDKGRVVAISFKMETELGEQEFRLPAEVEAVHRALMREYGNGEIQRRYTERDHAERVAWRLRKDWIEVTVTLIRLNVTTVAKELFAYMIYQDTRQTVFELAMSKRLALPAPADEGG